MITFLKMMSLSPEEGLNDPNGIEASFNTENDSRQQVFVCFVKRQSIHFVCFGGLSRMQGDLDQGREGRDLELWRFLSTRYPRPHKGKQGFRSEVDLGLSSVGTVDGYFKGSEEHAAQTG